MAEVDLIFEACARNDALNVAVLASKESCALREVKSGMTALMIAAKNGAAEALAIVLPLSDPCALSRKGESALIIAAKAGRGACVRALLPASDATACDHRGTWALLGAAWSGDLDSVMALLPHSDPLKKDADGNTALSAAISRGALELVRVLAPVSSHAGEWEGEQMSSIHLAMARNPESLGVMCIQELLPHVDLSMRGLRGWDGARMTVLEMAREFCFPEIERVILSRLAEISAQAEADKIALAARGPEAFAAPMATPKRRL